MLINIKTTTKQLTKKRARHYTNLHIICFEYPNKSPLKSRCVPQKILEWKVSNLKNPPIIPVAFTPEYPPPPPQFPPCEWIMLLREWLKRSLQFPLHKLDLQVIYNWKTDEITSGTREVDLHGWLWAVQGWTGNNNNLIISKIDRCKYLSKIYSNAP